MLRDAAALYLLGILFLVQWLPLFVPTSSSSRTSVCLPAVLSGQTVTGSERAAFKWVGAFSIGGEWCHYPMMSWDRFSLLLALYFALSGLENLMVTFFPGLYPGLSQLQPFRLRRYHWDDQF